MVDGKELELLSKKSAAKGEAGILTDLLDVTLQGDTPMRRLESYLAQTGNPYCFRVGQTPVRLLFPCEGKPLAELLKAYLISLKNGEG